MYTLLSGAPQGRCWLALGQSMLDSHDAVARVLQEASVNVTVLRAADIVVMDASARLGQRRGRMEPRPTLS